MSKIRRYSFPISCFLIVLAVAGFCAELFLALRSPVPPRPELHQQLVEIEPDGPGAYACLQALPVDLPDALDHLEQPRPARDLVRL